jgi:hypothetical protein
MITEEQHSGLVSEFGELADPDIILPKEVYAHFGLLFFKFSLVENSMINILLFHHLGTELAARRIRSKEDWEKAHDKGYDDAKGKTFGNLMKAVLKVPEFSSFAAEFAEIKRLRDYFAHHFFREEVGMYASDDNEGCWHILWAMKRLRDRLMKLDDELRQPFEQMCKRLRVPLATDDVLKDGAATLIAEAKARIDKGRPFDWCS